MYLRKGFEKSNKPLKRQRITLSSYTCDCFVRFVTVTATVSILHCCFEILQQSKICLHVVLFSLLLIILIVILTVLPATTFIEKGVYKERKKEEKKLNKT